ncbi:MAG: DUF1761 domain-containing protein [Ferruginibacter sp.]
MSTLFDYINWIAVGLGALGYFILGALWYSKLLFVKPWIRYLNIDVNKPDAKKGMGLMFGGSFILMFVQSLAIAIIANRMFPEEPTNWMSGIKIGCLLGLCFSSATIGINYLYEKKPFGLFLINAGYAVAGNIIAGVIICSWR